MIIAAVFLALGFKRTEFLAAVRPFLRRRPSD